MELESQVCSLELAKRIKELGFKQDSLFYYLNIDGEGEYYVYYEQHMPEEFEYEGEPIAAFTSSELMDMLPAHIDIRKNEPFNNFWLVIQKKRVSPINYIINYDCDTHEFTETSPFFCYKLMKKNIHDENLSNCLAKILIYLLEEKLITLDDFK